jgi:RNA polymerase sigma factor (sigma-70 family)
MAIATEFDVRTDSETQHDGELLGEVAVNSSAECFELLVARHSAMVLGVCRRQLDDSHDAEDAAQAVFLVLWEKAAALRRRNSVAGWLHHVARNVCRNVKRARKARKSHERKAAEMTDQDQTEPAKWDDIKQVLDNELDRLPDKYRLPIILCHLESRSQGEAAALLDVTQSTIAKRMKRGREILCQRLKRRGVTIGVATLATTLTTSATAAVVPATFTATTTQAATLFAAGKIAVGGALSAQTAALAKGTINMLTIAKIKMAAAVVATATVVTTTSVVVVQTVANAEPDKPAAVARTLPRTEMPVRVLWSHERGLDGKHEPLDWPLVTATSLPKLDDASTMKIVDTGTLTMTPPIDKRATTLVLVSPKLDRGKYWRPARVHRDGKNITLVTESWTNNEGRRKNFQRQSVYVVSLGMLDAGEYTLTLHVRDMFRDFEKRASTTHYHERSLKTASTKLRVFAGKANNNTQLATIDADNLKSSDGNGRAYQPALDTWETQAGGLRAQTIHYMEFKNGIDGLLKPGASSVGSYDLTAWKASPKTATDFQKLKYHPPTIGMPVCLRVQSMYMGLSDSMTLREMEWVGDRKVIVRLDMWRGGAVVFINYPRVPVLFVPLRHGNVPIKEPGEYEVQIEWNLWYDLPGKVYTHYGLENIDKAEMPKDVKSSYKYMATEQTALKFTLGPKPAGDNRIARLIDDLSNKENTREGGLRQAAATQELLELGQPAREALKNAKDQPGRPRLLIGQLLGWFDTLEKLENDRAAALTDAKRIQQVPLVLRVVADGSAGEGSKYIWTMLRVAEVLKNESSQLIPKKLKVAVYSSSKKAIPKGECTVYLEPYNKQPNHPWRLLKGNAENGVSHVMAVSKSLKEGVFELSTAVRQPWVLPKKGQASPLLLGIRVTNTADETKSFWLNGVLPWLRDKNGNQIVRRNSQLARPVSFGIPVHGGQSILLLMQSAELKFIGNTPGAFLVGDSFPDWGFHTSQAVAPGEYELNFWRNTPTRKVRTLTGPLSVRVLDSSAVQNVTVINEGT